MIIRQYTEEHYPILKEWWEKQDWQAMPEHMLPTTGLIAYDGDTPIAASFLYDTDSSYGLIEWFVGNPDVDHEVRAEGIDKVLNGLMVFAKLKGKKQIITYTNHKRLIEKFKSNDFIETDQNMVGLVRRV
jgi:hypothetical protein